MMAVIQDGSESQTDRPAWAGAVDEWRPSPSTIPSEAGEAIASALRMTDVVVRAAPSRQGRSGTRPSPAPATVDVQTTGTVRIAGELFNIELDPTSELVYLRHPRWSLLGAGATVAEAQEDMLQEATDLLSVLLGLPPGSLDEQARRLRDYLFRIATV